ncbi:hypothetical protein DLD77_06355 [Chitinophaga alhagiae]|uniref:Protein-glutamine gamma-glutamyltransferase-like C-terminal domain-containing protein n=1 Tax=Chitinophaga alhagiae TaxID=2203219 RepID=A0ABN5LQ19_9BACT|nr:DUF4129 domain-containing protein [Chitinophaga alhagiae]AWO01337.1 hypothetical protein DLD77_06355 [Chitinophaga alhagiae]
MNGVKMLIVAACMLWGARAAGQDSIGADNFRYVDTAAAGETDAEEDNTDLEGKVRNGSVAHSTWDSQVPGEWSDGSQTRLTIRKVPAATLKNLRAAKALQYQRAGKSQPPNWATRALVWITAHGSALQGVLLWLLAILLFAIIVLFIQKNDIPVFRWKRRATVDEDEPAAASGPVNYDAQAQAAIAAGNYREAVRMRYLQTLQALQNRELIAPGKDKTNMDYLRELAPTAWHKPFAALTLHYEYVWYGKLPLSNGQFSHLEEQFFSFRQSLNQHR